MGDDQPGEQAAEPQSHHGQRQRQHAVFDQLHRQHLPPVRAEDAQDHRIVGPRRTRSGDGPQQHGKTRQHGNACRGQRGEADLFEQRARLFENAADLDHRGRRKFAHQPLENRCSGRLVRKFDRGGEIVRHIVERIGAEHEDVIEAQAFPIDRAQIGYARGPLGPQHAEGQQIADFEPGSLGEFLIDRDQRLALMERAPPVSFDDGVARGNLVGIGQAAFAAQRPRAVGDFLELGGAGHVAVRPEGQHRAAQGGNGADIGFGIFAADEIFERRNAIARNVEDEVIGGLIGNAALDIPVDRGLDCGEEHEGGKPEAERSDQRASRRAGAVEIGKRVARDRIMRARERPGDFTDR